MAGTNSYAYLLFVFLTAVLVAQVSQLITVAREADAPHAYSDNKAQQLGSLDDDLFVFAQITDLHISMFRSPDRYNQLKDFCRTSLQLINPRVVIVSGDITDAIARNLIIAKQFEDEWKLYHSFYNNCMSESGITNWLDLRGNHDNFNVDGYYSPTNYFPKYAAQRSRPPGSYMAVVHEPNGDKNYAFVAVDATLDLGPKRILNFFGHLDQEDLDRLKEFQRVIESSNVDAYFWFGHYPTSSIASPDDLRTLGAKSIAYFSGHLHTWGKLVSRMYSSHHSGMLELELADWKDSRTYRIAVMDHGLFTFADVKHGVWPAVVVLNPKPLITVQPSKEPFYLVANSTHIRLLIYSPSDIELCEVRIDEGNWEPCQRSGEKIPLYTAPWNPSHYAHGVHALEVNARDSSGSHCTTKTVFALDGTSPDFPLMARIALMTNLHTAGQILFLLFFAALLLPLLYFRIERASILKGKSTPRNVRGIFSRGFRIITSIDFFFYPLTFYTSYLIVGPWYAGDLIDGRIGVVFLWRTFYLTGDVQYGNLTSHFGAFHLLTFNFPLFVLIAHVANTRFKETLMKSSTSEEMTWWKRHRKTVPFLCFMTFHFCTTVIFSISYGWMATLINPFRTWALVLSWFLWHRAVNLNVKDFEHALKSLSFQRSATIIPSPSDSLHSSKIL